MPVPLSSFTASARMVYGSVTNLNCFKPVSHIGSFAWGRGNIRLRELCSLSFVIKDSHASQICLVLRLLEKINQKRLVPDAESWEWLGVI
jgi:hypothetical protein